MLKIGVQTKGIIDEYRIRQGFERIRRAGFDCVDFNLDAFLTNHEIYGGELNHFFEQSDEELARVFRPYQEAMAGCGLVPAQMHAPYPVRVYGRERQNRFMEMAVIPKSLRIAGLLGIPYVVVHPIKLQQMEGREAERKQNREYFRSLIPLARENQVMLCLENLYEGFGGRIVEGVCADPAEALWYLEGLNADAGEERFGFCLDTGHMNLVGRDPCETIRALGKHIKILHLHDNDMKGDVHQMPYTFLDKDGHGFGVNWARAIQGLRDIRYAGVLNYETGPCISGFPPQAADAALGVMAQIGRYMAREIESTGMGITGRGITGVEIAGREGMGMEIAGREMGGNDIRE